ncbi:MAG: TonB-dependent receptor [Kofleriaceae bacterium]
MPRLGWTRPALWTLVVAALTPARARAQATPPPAAVTEDDAASYDPELVDPGEFELIEVESTAPPESASSVHFDADDLRRRPHDQPSDLMRQTPGLVVAQHAGGGKSDQYFLRGFDADHGTDVAIFVDGIPVNLTSHGHGQGYADAHWIIPETIAALDVHKGPYAARFGDYYTAGAIELTTSDVISDTTVWLTGGTELAGPVAFTRAPSSRLVGMASPRLGGGRALLAVEAGAADGPFVAPQGFQRAAALAKWKRPLAGGELKLAGTFYAARWHQSGQVPAAAVAAGLLDRFGSLDPTEGGDSARASVAVGYERGAPADGAWNLDAYLVRYQLQLFSNFTLFARDTMAGDQIEQGDDRLVGGARATYRRTHRFGRASGLLRAGLDARVDGTTTDLWHTEARVRLPGCFDNANPCNHTRNRVADVAAYVEEDLSIGSRVRLLGGLRVDGFGWRVTDLDPATAGTMATTAGAATAAIVSPKLSAIVRAADGVDLFVNSGFGFHSNDARAAVASEGRGALARAVGAEAGVRIAPGPGLRTTIDAWYLHLASEQVWSGDAGGTEPSDPTRRWGIDAELAWEPTAWLAVDANVAVARATFVANAGNGGALALAPRIMGGGGVAVHHGQRELSLRVRGIGDRPANDDGSLIAQGYALVDLVGSVPVGRATIGVTVTNLLDAAWREAQFAEASRVTPTAPVVEDVHFTPGGPRTALVSVGYRL